MEMMDYIFEDDRTPTKFLRYSANCDRGMIGAIVPSSLLPRLMLPNLDITTTNKPNLFKLLKIAFFRRLSF